jgi:hypothetical protein
MTYSNGEKTKIVAFLVAALQDCKKISYEMIIYSEFSAEKK